MAKDRMDVLGLLRKEASEADPDFPRAGAPGAEPGSDGSRGGQQDRIRIGRAARSGSTSAAATGLVRGIRGRARWI